MPSLALSRAAANSGSIGDPRTDRVPLGLGRVYGRFFLDEEAGTEGLGLSEPLLEAPENSGVVIWDTGVGGMGKCASYGGPRVLATEGRCSLGCAAGEGMIGNKDEGVSDSRMFSWGAC